MDGYLLVQSLSRRVMIFTTPASSRRITGARSVGQMSSRGWRFGIASGHVTGMRVWEKAAR
jgi:hypothetical protein